MRNQHYFRNKKITVVGLGRSGFACAGLLHNMGAQLSVTEKENNARVADYVRQLSPLIKIELGRHTQEFIQGRDLIVVSPGVDNSSPPLLWARQLGIPIISEIECAWILCPASVIAITGTNGKTTTTTLIGKILEAAGKKVFVLGNIGTPFSAYVQQMQSQDFVSLEVSSFQLETIRDFKPKIAILLNFSPDHLDRYKGLSEYLSAKSRIFMNQDESDYLVLNYDHPLIRKLDKEAKSQIVYFDSRMHSNPDFAAVMAVASVLGIDAGLCSRVFYSFKGLPHRLEWVSEFKQREFINDSKATNPEATVYALVSITKPVVLIAGGRDKGCDYTIIQDSLCKKIRSLVLIGEAKEKIRQIFQCRLPIREASDLRDAVKFAFQESRPGDCVLLSPMCSSFDMFRDYEHRGEMFREAVFELRESL